MKILKIIKHIWNLPENMEQIQGNFAESERSAKQAHSRIMHHEKMCPDLKPGAYPDDDAMGKE